MNVIKEERQKTILKRLEGEKKIWVSKLADILDVTPETIRRDLAELENKELLTRVHGGAVTFIPSQKELAFQRKLDMNREVKIKIAARAAEYINNGDFIAIDVGTTTVHIADMIQNLENVTVVTNSIAAAERFNLALEEKRMTGRVIMLGGITNPEQSSVAGAMTLELLSQMKINKSFISCGGVTKTTIYEYDLDESLVSAEMVKQSTSTFLLTDDSKVGKSSFFSICSIDMVNEIITNKHCPQDWVKSLNRKNIKWTLIS